MSWLVEFEASHGTVADLWHSHLRGEETSLNPLGLVVALLGAINHSAELHGGPNRASVENFTHTLRKALENTFRYNFLLTGMDVIMIIVGMDKERRIWLDQLDIQPKSLWIKWLGDWDVTSRRPRKTSLRKISSFLHSNFVGIVRYKIDMMFD